MLWTIWDILVQLQRFIYRAVAVLKKDGLKCYIIVNTQSQGQASTVASKYFLFNSLDLAYRV